MGFWRCGWVGGAIHGDSLHISSQQLLHLCMAQDFPGPACYDQAGARETSSNALGKAAAA